MENRALSRAADGATLAEPRQTAGRRRSRPTSVEWLALAVAVVLTIQYAWLIDDAFVYFRYVDNALYAGRGLVYNAGEYVEGFSSPAWMMTLLAVRASGFGWWLAVRLLGLLGCLGFWALAVRVHRETAPDGVPRFALPLLVLAPNYAVLCYFTSGVETPLVQVAAVAFALVVLRPRERWIQVVAGLGPMVRHELVVPWLLLVVWCGWRTRRMPWALVGTTAATGTAWTLFRVGYFAELLPNTFYLKNVSLVRQGVLYLRDTVEPYGLHWLLAAAAAGFAGLAWHDHRDRRGAGRDAPEPARLRLAERIVMVVLALSVAAYVVKIGGDSRHYRYLAFPVCLAVMSTAGLPEHLLARSRWRVPRVAPLVAGLLLMTVAFTRYPRQLPRHPILATLGGEPAIPDQHDRSAKGGPALINDAAAHRHHPDLACPPWGRCEKVDRRAAYRAMSAVAGAPHRGLIVEYWCAGIYARPQDRALHSLGLTDPFLARTRMPHERPGHKWGLVAMASELARIELATGNRPAPGMFRRALAEGLAPPWVRANLAPLEVVERKAYNRHRVGENVRLALTFPPAIDPRRR